MAMQEHIPVKQPHNKEHDQNRQPLKIMSSLKKISSLNLSSEKIALMEDSMFFRLSKVRNKKESSATLIAALCQFYDTEKKMFILNNQTSFSFCQYEVAAILGIQDSGTDFSKPSSTDKYRFPSFLNELRKSFNDKEGNIMAADIREIICKMAVNTEEEKLRFRQLMSYYIIEQMLLCSSNTKKPRSSFWSLVEDLHMFESVNWAKATFEHLLDSISEVKLKINKGDKGQISFKGAAPVLEALVYERVSSIRPQAEFGSYSLLIEKYGPQRNDMSKWNLSQLTVADISPCQYIHGHPLRSTLYASTSTLIHFTADPSSLEENESAAISMEDGFDDLIMAEEANDRRRSARISEQPEKLIEQISGKQNQKTEEKPEKEGLSLRYGGVC